MLRRISLFLIAFTSVVLLAAGPASAHNTLLSSDPADGESVSVAPSQLTLVFDKSVPLDTLSIELIDASGVRTTLTGSTHGTTGDTEVVTPLPALAPGEVNTRWRLVGPDGHPITGRVRFVVAAAPVTTAEPSSETTVVGASPATTPPSTVAAPATASDAATSSDVGFAESWSTPSTVRWLFRMLSYLAIMTIGGVIATTAFVWTRAWSQPSLQRLVMSSLVAAAAFAICQLLVIASDIQAVPIWRSFGGVAAAFETDAGIALAIRVVLIVGLAWVMFMMPARDEWTRWAAAGVCTVLLLATWAYAGHSQSMRWSLIGIPFDVAHHAAAAAWLGGLAIVGIAAMRDTEADERVEVVQRFARLAATSVVVIVGTGAVQAIRLVGNPTRLLVAEHGRYLLLKLAVIGIMLKVADINRQRVNQRFIDARSATPLAVYNLRRAMGTELAVGLGVIAVTAAMVVSPPAVAQEVAVAVTSTLPAELSTTTTLAATTTTTTTTTGSDGPIGAPAYPPCSINVSLSDGATGDDVVCLQQALIVQSTYDGSASGTFDAATADAVKEFQANRQLSADGVVGPLTATELGIWAAS